MDRAKAHIPNSRKMNRRVVPALLGALNLLVALDKKSNKALQLTVVLEQSESVLQVEVSVCLLVAPKVEDSLQQRLEVLQRPDSQRVVDFLDTELNLDHLVVKLDLMEANLVPTAVQLDLLEADKMEPLDTAVLRKVEVLGTVVSRKVDMQATL